MVRRLSRNSKRKRRQMHSNTGRQGRSGSWRRGGAGARRARGRQKRRTPNFALIAQALLLK
eukprot:6210484-Pleurochrysis_carterae.AAC.2